MVVPPGNEGSNGPQLTSPVPGLAPDPEQTGHRDRRSLPTGGSTGRGASGSGCAPSTAATPPWSTWRSPRACSSSARAWVIETPSRPSQWFVAALIFPLVFRRRAPMTVFLIIAAVAFVQWLVTGPALADVSLLVALYTVALESEWVLVASASVILEAGVVMATVRWRPTGNDVKSFVFLTGLAFTALLAGVVVRALRSQLDWLAERAERLEVERDQQASLAAAAERARIAREMHDVVSHNIQVMVTLADAASRAQASDPARAVEAMQEVSSTGRQALTDMRRMLGVLREDPAGGGGGNGAARPSFAPQPGLRDLDALVERVRGTGLAVSVDAVGPALRGLERRRPDGVPHRPGGTDQRAEARRGGRDGGGAPGVRRPRRLGAGRRRRAHEGDDARVGAATATVTAAGARSAVGTAWRAWRSGRPPSAARSTPAPGRRGLGGHGHVARLQGTADHHCPH